MFSHMDNKNWKSNSLGNYVQHLWWKKSNNICMYWYFYVGITNLSVYTDWLINYIFVD